MSSFVEKFYNNGDKLIPQKIKDQINSIDFTKIRCDFRSNTNHDLESELKKLGWKKNLRIGQQKKFMIDFWQDGIGLEVELRQGTNLIHDLLKLQLGFYQKKLNFALIITYDKSVRIVGENGMDACIQTFDKLVNEFRNIVKFDIPLWIIGLKSNT